MEKSEIQRLLYEYYPYNIDWMDERYNNSTEISNLNNKIIQEAGNPKLKQLSLELKEDISIRIDEPGVILPTSPAYIFQYSCGVVNGYEYIITMFVSLIADFVTFYIKRSKYLNISESEFAQLLEEAKLKFRQLDLNERAIEGQKLITKAFGDEVPMHQIFWNHFPDEIESNGRKLQDVFLRNGYSTLSAELLFEPVPNISVNGISLNHATYFDCLFINQVPY